MESANNYCEIFVNYLKDSSIKAMLQIKWMEKETLDNFSGQSI